jgi:hypothetical protein
MTATSLPTLLFNMHTGLTSSVVSRIIVLADLIVAKHQSLPVAVARILRIPE